MLVPISWIHSSFLSRDPDRIPVGFLQCWVQNQYNGDLSSQSVKHDFMILFLSSLSSRLAVRSDLFKRCFMSSFNWLVFAATLLLCSVVIWGYSMSRYFLFDICMRWLPNTWQYWMVCRILVHLVPLSEESNDWNFAWFVSRSFGKYQAVNLDDSVIRRSKSRNEFHGEGSVSLSYHWVKPQLIWNNDDLEVGRTR